MPEASFANLGRGVLGSLARCGMLFALAYTLINSTNAVGSVVIPQPVALNASDFVHATASGAGVLERDLPTNVAPHERSNDFEKSRLIDHGYSPSNTSTTGNAGSSGSGPSNFFAIGMPLSFELCDVAIVQWLRSKEGLLLPTPPGNELLRPPQMV